jgi:hypothetical protein
VFETVQRYNPHGYWGFSILKGYKGVTKALQSAGRGYRIRTLSTMVGAHSENSKAEHHGALRESAMI